MGMREKDWMDEDSRIQNFLLKIVHRYFAISFSQFAQYDIYPGQVPVVILLSKREGLSQSEICRELKIKPSTVAVSMKRMEKNGLIIRKPDEKDQRIQRIYGTDKLKVLQKEIYKLVRKNEEVMMDGFTESELHLMNRFLHQIYDALSGEGESGRDAFQYRDTGRHQLYSAGI